MNLSTLSRAELAAVIATHLAGCGIEVVLSGGSCVSIYSGGKYVSSDLDFVNVGYVKRARLIEAMASMGFREENRYFVHPDCSLIVEFPPGPLAVGDEPVKAPATMETSKGKFRLLSPTDCVKDRLAGFFHWGDRQCLEQASMVARQAGVDLAELEKWASAEGKQKEFRRIRKDLEG